MGFGWSFSPSAQPARVIGAQSCLPDSCQHLHQLQLSASQSSASDPGDMLHPHSAWPSLVLVHTTLESPTQRPQVLHVVKALSGVLFYLIWLCVAFLPFVLMFLSDLICIQITSPGGSPIRGKNAVRAFRHATPHHATPHHCCRCWSPPLHPVQSVTSPYPSCPLQSLHLQLQPPSTTSHHTPPLSHFLPWTHPLQVCIVDILAETTQDGKPCHTGFLGQLHRTDPFGSHSES